MIDADLIKKYDEVYKAGENSFWSKLPVEERIAILANVDIKGKNILEIGCGTGDFAAWMASAGAKHVTGIDASEEAIRLGWEKYKIKNMALYNAKIDDQSEEWRFDIVVMVGVLEHVEDPQAFLELISDRFMAQGSVLASSSPCFLNPRGYIWVAIKTLYDEPLSLTDRHEISPTQMKKWLETAGMELKHLETVDHSWGFGIAMINDYRRRLPLVYNKDAEKMIRIDRLLDYLEADIPHHMGHGANAVYIAVKK